MKLYRILTVLAGTDEQYDIVVAARNPLEAAQVIHDEAPGYVFLDEDPVPVDISKPRIVSIQEVVW